MRKAQCFIWVDPDDCEAPHELNMSSEYNSSKVEGLRKMFEKDGFDLNYPALVGYPLDGRIQLLSGTHRHRAATQAGIQLPVTLWLRSDVERMWGTKLWDKAIEDIAVKDLVEVNIKEGFHVPPYDRMDVKQLYAKDL